MLEQSVAVMPGTLIPVLLVTSLSVVLTVDEGRDKPIGSHWHLIDLIIGLIAAIIFAGLCVLTVANQHTFISYPVSWCAIITGTLIIVVVVFVRRIITNWQQHKVFMYVASVVTAIDIALALFHALPDVILQLAIWMEPGGTAFISTISLRVLGFLFDVAISIVVVAIFCTMRTTAVRQAFTMIVTTMMVILLIQHFTGLAQILQTRSFLMNHAMFVALARSVNQSSTMTMVQALVFLIPAVVSVVAGFRMKTHDILRANEVTSRRHKVFHRHAIAATVWSLIAAVSVTVILTVGIATAHQTIILSPPETYSLKDGVATIPFSQVKDDRLHHFEYKAKGGIVMRLITIRESDGAYGIDLDACKNCGGAGYYKRDGKTICKKCEVAVNPTTIGFKGGCSPIPFPYRTGHGKITIQTTDLSALSVHFRWVRRKIRITFFLHMITRSFTRQLRRHLLIALAVCPSTTVPASILGIVFDMGDKLNTELSTHGSNITMQPKAGAVVFGLHSTGSGGATSTNNLAVFLKESDAAGIKTIFWSSNITSFVPQFNIHTTVNSANMSVIGTQFNKNSRISTGETTVMDVKGMRSQWQLDGKWPKDDSDQGVIGKTLASGLGVTTGDTITPNKTIAPGERNEQKIKLTGVYDSGDEGNDSSYIVSSTAQILVDLLDSINKIEIKALIIPENDLARKVAADLAAPNREEWGTWYCTAYLSSIAYQIEGVIPGVVVKQARQMAALRGNVL